MERKRVAGRFIAEDKGGVAKKRAATSRTEKTSIQQETVRVQPDTLDHNDIPKQRSKGLLKSLIERLKKSPKDAREGFPPIHADDAE